MVLLAPKLYLVYPILYFSYKPFLPSLTDMSIFADIVLVSDFFWSQGGRCSKLTSPNRPAPDRSLIGSGSVSMSWVCSTQRSSPHYITQIRFYKFFQISLIYSNFLSVSYSKMPYIRDLNTVQETY